MIEKLYRWYGKRTVIITFLVLVVLVGVGLYSKSTPDIDSEPKEEGTLPLVIVSTPALEADDSNISLIGKVSAANEVILKSEAGGRVISVNTKLGANVRTGQVLVQLENSSERAAVLQAEGVYEAAIAGSAQTDQGVGQAKTQLQGAIKSAQTTTQSAYSTANNIVLNTLDVFYSNPTAGIIGLRIGGVGNTPFLNSERVALREVLPNWRSESQTTKDVDGELAKLNTSYRNTERVVNLVDTFIELMNDDRSIRPLPDSQVATYLANLTSARSQLVSTLNSIDNARTNLRSAEDNLEKVELSASGSESSVSDAQIKQALGTLRSAQANLAKTIVRSPINGTVNSFDIKVGEFVGVNQDIATIANNAKIEISTFVSDKQRSFINVGDEVLIDGKGKGVVSIIAPTASNDTGKIEVRISSDDESLLIGDTVRITTSQSNEELDEVRIPLTALKLNATESRVLIVEDNVLKSIPVTLGEIIGTNVVIEDGLDMNTEFVLDVRGRNEGEKVEVNNKQ